MKRRKYKNYKRQKDLISAAISGAVKRSNERAALAMFARVVNSDFVDKVKFVLKENLCQM
jgi:hypothetical protein